MELLLALIKGALQGLTEFLPVSSTAHLIFFEALARMIGLETVSPDKTTEEFFDIMLHIGTLAAVLVYFRRELWLMWEAARGKTATEDAGFSWGDLSFKAAPRLVFVSMVITVVWILGMLKGTEILFSTMGWATPQVENLSDFYLVYPQWVAVHLLGTGTFLYLTERWSEKRHDVGETVGRKHALIIGWAQGMAAIFHGFSRSGSTITAGLATGLDRLTATRYSFLLSIPTFVMAAVYEALKLWKAGGAEHLNWPAMLAGTLCSAVVGYACIRFFIQYVASHRLYGFAAYCWVVGLGMLFML